MFISFCFIPFEYHTMFLIITANKCESIPYPCHVNASCKTSVNGTDVTCQCNAGYQGDGIICDAINPCQNSSGGCPTESTSCVYTGPAQVS